MPNANFIACAMIAPSSAKKMKQKLA